jgi:hypothetical protein
MVYDRPEVIAPPTIEILELCDRQFDNDASDRLSHTGILVLSDRRPIGQETWSDRPTSATAIALSSQQRCDGLRPTRGHRPSYTEILELYDR